MSCDHKTYVYPDLNHVIRLWIQVFKGILGTTIFIVALVGHSICRLIARQLARFNRSIVRLLD